LDDKAVRDFDKMSDKLSDENDKLESKNGMLDIAIDRYEEKAVQAEADGDTEKAAKYQAKADELKVEKASNESLIQINEKQILVIDMSTGKIPVDYYQTIIYKYDNLDDDTINGLLDDIEDNLKEIEKLEKEAAKYDQKAEKALEGDTKKAAKYEAKADKYEARADKYQARADYYSEKADKYPSRADYYNMKAEKYEAKAAKYDAKAAKYDQKAQDALEGDTEKAAKYEAKAIQAREEIAIYEDLNDVLKYAITFSLDMLENRDDDKHKHDDYNEKKWNKYWNKSYNK
jgi:hypothetical protein